MSRLSATPVLARRLDELQRRLRLSVGLWAAGTVVLAACLWLAFSFLADWGLRVPSGVRWFHLVVLFSGTGYLIHREGLRRWRTVPAGEELAQLLERGAPGSSELLPSAVSFQSGAEPERPELERQLVGQVLEQAEARAAECRPEVACDLRPSLRRLGLGALALVLLGGAGAAAPGHASIFLVRFFGGSTPWPQRTQLSLDLPLADGAAAVEREGDGQTWSLMVARGTDVPVVVTAEGVVPDTVQLRFEDGRALALVPGSDGRFSTVLRSVADDANFYAVGGDDRDGTPAVELRVVDPPDIAAVAFEITPPEYAGLPTRFVDDGDARALAGSRVRAWVRTDPPGVRGNVLVLPDDETLPLVAGPFPQVRGVDGEGADGELSGSPALFFETTVERSLRLRFELTDERGLSNPDPGFFGVDLVPDQSPELRWLSPARSDVEVTAAGAVPLRALAEDDLGLEGLRLFAAEVGADAEPRELAPLVNTTLEGGATARPTAILAERRLELSELLEPTADGGDSVGRQFELFLEAFDARQPAQPGRAQVLRLRVLSEDELLRRLQDRLARARLEAVELAEMQRERRQTVDDLLTARSEERDALDERSLAAVASGQRRVQAEALGLARELASIAEQTLYARLDEDAANLLLRYEEIAAGTQVRGYEAQRWIELESALPPGEAEASGIGLHLTRSVVLAARLESERLPEATAALEVAERSPSFADREAAVLAAFEAQSRALDDLEALVDRLAEWDNFQSVLSLTRDILNRQKALSERTKRYAQDK
ncbi:MAG: hypothetical protein ACYS26_15825 [Planctomycetota bacterium]|jgi:hypothetical protein